MDALLLKCDIDLLKFLRFTCFVVHYYVVPLKTTVSMLSVINTLYLIRTLDFLAIGLLSCTVHRQSHRLFDVLGVLTIHRNEGVVMGNTSFTSDDPNQKLPTSFVADTINLAPIRR